MSTDEEKMLAVLAEMHKNLSVIQQKINMLQADIQMLKLINKILETN